MSDEGNKSTKSDIASLLLKVMPTTRKEREEVARQVGYEKPHMLSMFANGEAKVPIDKVPALAAVLRIDPGRLLRLAVKQYFPASSLIADLLTERVVSENEAVLINALRVACGNANSAFTPEQVQAAVRLLSGAAQGSEGDQHS